MNRACAIARYPTITVAGSVSVMGGAADHDDASDATGTTGTTGTPVTDAVAPDAVEPDESSLDELPPVPPVPFDAGGDLATRVANARRRHGSAGAMLAAGMLGVDQVVNGRKPREEAPIVIASNSDPLDIDTDGISVSLDDHDVVAPPLPRTAPITGRISGRARRGRR